MRSLTEQEEELLNLIADRDPSLNNTDWFQFNENLTFMCFICNENIPFGPIKEMDNEYEACLDFENYVNHGRMHLAKKRKIIGFL